MLRATLGSPLLICRVSYLHTHADFSGLVVCEVNACLFKGLLYFEDRRKVSFHNSFVLLDPLKRRQAHPGGSGKLILAPAQERSSCPYLRRISHRFAVFSIRSWLTTS